MAMVMQPVISSAKATAFWRNPAEWLKQQKLSREYWIFFTAALFFDAGFAAYFFLFNLFLLDLHFDERSMGLVGGALTLGSLVGTLPAGALIRRHGARPLLVFCFIAAPLLGALRALVEWPPAAILVAFFMGLAMSLWGVCMLPTVAATTTPQNRAQGFSLIFSVSIGTGALGGLLCSAAPRWLQHAGFAMAPVEIKRIILLGSCAVALMGLVAVYRLPLKAAPADDTAVAQRWLAVWKIEPFLARYLPCMALWAAVLTAFTPFANVYLTRSLHLPLPRVALIFSGVQLVQFSIGLVTPMLLRVLGLRNGLAVMQGGSAVLLAGLSMAHQPMIAIPLYLAFAAAQWMSSPALYNLLMNETAAKERGTAAAMTMFCNALAGSAAVVVAGACFARFGYPPVLLGIALLALLVAVLFRGVVAPRVRMAEEL